MSYLRLSNSWVIKRRCDAGTNHGGAPIPRWRSLASLPVSLAPLAAQSPSARRGEAPRAVPMCVTPVSQIKDRYPRGR